MRLSRLNQIFTPSDSASDRESADLQSPGERIPLSSQCPGRPAVTQCSGLVAVKSEVRTGRNPRKIAIFLSRRWDSNPRPVVYETVVGSASECPRVHLFALSCLMVPDGAICGQNCGRKSVVVLAVDDGARASAPESDLYPPAPSSVEASAPSSAGVIVTGAPSAAARPAAPSSRARVCTRGRPVSPRRATRRRIGWGSPLGRWYGMYSGFVIRRTFHATMS
jgi:hypothetical protein